jgi:hypothetical protein
MMIPGCYIASIAIDSFVPNRIRLDVICLLKMVSAAFAEVTNAGKGRSMCFLGRPVGVFSVATASVLILVEYTVLFTLLANGNVRNAIGCDAREWLFVTRWMFAITTVDADARTVEWEYVKMATNTTF